MTSPPANLSDTAQLTSHHSLWVQLAQSPSSLASSSAFSPALPLPPLPLLFPWGYSVWNTRFWHWLISSFRSLSMRPNLPFKIKTPYASISFLTFTCCYGMRNQLYSFIFIGFSGLYPLPSKCVLFRRQTSGPAPRASIPKSGPHVSLRSARALTEAHS